MNTRKISLFLLITFGISWFVALMMYLADIQYGSVLSMVLVAVLYMPAPAYATLIVQKIIYKGELKQYGWNFERGTIKWALIAMGIGALLLPLTLFVSWVLGNKLGLDTFGQVDLSESGIMNALMLLMEQTGQTGAGLNEILEEGFPFPTELLLPIVLLAGAFSSITFNLPFMFGEEFGWRGLLLHETRKMGLLKNTLFIGIIWGIWHAPIILMGHNYPDSPIIGVLMMCGLTTAFCIPFAYVRMKGKSILAPCILHGMVNSTAGAALIFQTNADPLFGSMAGIAGILVLVLISIGIVIFDPLFFKVSGNP